MTRLSALALTAALTLASLGCGRGQEKATAGGLPADSGFVATDDGVRLFYRTIGAGPLNVVIPVGFYLEEALLPLARAERRLVFYDPRARGRSEAGDRSRITLDRLMLRG